MTYRVWRLGLASKYYEGRRALSTESDDREILDRCLRDGSFPFHVWNGYVPSEYPTVESFRGEDDSSTWKGDLWRIYNLIKTGDRVVLTKVKKSEDDVHVYAKGTVISSPRHVQGADPFGYSMKVAWDPGFGEPKSAKALKGNPAFYKELTDYKDWEAQLKSCGELELYQKTMNNKKYKSLNSILCGPPGTGKTFATRRIACEICNGTIPPESRIAEEFEKLTATDQPLVEFVTFHPSYDYSDFIEGYKPDASGNFVVTPGVLKRMAARAARNPSQNYLLIIDEINRGNISKIFGEAITLLEEDKRTKGGFPINLRLPTSPKDTFVLPQNLYVVGTMNTADRSIAMLDVALRRRFDFSEVMPDPSLLKDAICSDKARGVLSQRKLLANLNRWISDKLASRDHQIGHAWLDMSDKPTVEKVAALFTAKIIPLLLEWFYEPEQRAMLFKDLFGKPGLEASLFADAEKAASSKDLVDSLYEIASPSKDKSASGKK